MVKKHYKYYELNRNDYDDDETNDSNSVFSDDSYDSDSSFDSYVSTYSNDCFEPNEDENSLLNILVSNIKKVNKIDVIHPNPIDFVSILENVPFTYLTNLKTGQKIKQKMCKNKNDYIKFA
tara:strand:+ start:273 stop:635 length:363 start_codon:yes stop_codon:yes gene_type:complete